MYEIVKSTLKQLTFDELDYLNSKNDLRIQRDDLMTFHQLLSEHWHEIMDESSLSLKTDRLEYYCNPNNTSKYHELITTIKRNIIFNKK